MPRPGRHALGPDCVPCPASDGRCLCVRYRIARDVRLLRRWLPTGRHGRRAACWRAPRSCMPKRRQPAQRKTTRPCPGKSWGGARVRAGAETASTPGVASVTAATTGAGGGGRSMRSLAGSVNRVVSPAAIVRVVRPPSDVWQGWPCYRPLCRQVLPRISDRGTGAPPHLRRWCPVSWRPFTACTLEMSIVNGLPGSYRRLVRAITDGYR
jgi:hypothetical protein